ILTLQLEVRRGRVALRRPLQHEVRDPQRALAAERLRDRVAERVQVLECSVARRRAQVREAGAPGSARTYVTADMPEQRPGADAVAAAIGRGKDAPAPDLGAQFDEEVGRRDPFQLQAVVLPPAAEECLVRERCVLEIPCVLMDLVLVADAGEKPAALEREAAAEREGLEKRLLDLE